MAALVTGTVTRFERTSGVRLHDAERRRYQRLLGELEQLDETSVDFAKATR